MKALARTLEPIGDVDVEEALHSEMFGCVGLAPNRQEPMEGAGAWIPNTRQNQSAPMTQITTWAIGLGP